MILWSVRSRFHWCKNYKNRPRNARVIVENKTVPFFMEHHIQSRSLPWHILVQYGNYFYAANNDDEKAKCKLCLTPTFISWGKTVKSYGTLSLINHLKAKIRQSFVKCKSRGREKWKKSRQINYRRSQSRFFQKMEHYIMRTQPLDLKHQRCKEITDAVDRMIALDLQPYESIVEDSGFHQLIYVFDLNHVTHFPAVRLSRKTSFQSYTPTLDNAWWTWYKTVQTSAVRQMRELLPTSALRATGLTISSLESQRYWVPPVSTAQLSESGIQQNSLSSTPLLSSTPCMAYHLHSINSSIFKAVFINRCLFSFFWFREISWTIYYYMNYDFKCILSTYFTCVLCVCNACIYFYFHF